MSSLSSALKRWDETFRRYRELWARYSKIYGELLRALNDIMTCPEEVIDHVLELARQAGFTPLDVHVDIYRDEVGDLIFEMQVVVPAGELQEPDAIERKLRLTKLFYSSLGQFLREHFVVSLFDVRGAHSNHKALSGKRG